MPGLVTVLLCVAGGRLNAQQAQVTPLMTKDLTDIPARRL